MTNSDYTIYFGCSPMPSLCVRLLMAPGMVYCWNKPQPAVAGCGIAWIGRWASNIGHTIPRQITISQGTSKKQQHLWNCEIWTCIWHKTVDGCHMLSYVVIKLDIKHWTVIKYDGIYHHVLAEQKTVDACCCASSPISCLSCLFSFGGVQVWEQINYVIDMDTDC